jgi:hypothetical protein
MSHTIPPIDQLKRRAYCKFHNSFSHATNDCNTFRWQIQSAIDEGRLKFHEMQVDKNPFPNNAFVNTLELSNLGMDPDTNSDTIFEPFFFDFS